MNHIVTLDVGTTHLKAILFSPDGINIKKIYKQTPYVKKTDGISEIDLTKTIEIIAGFLKELSVSGYPIDAVTVSGMASSVIPVDEQGTALYPCICWDDQRVSQSFYRDIEPIKEHLQQYPLPAYPHYRFEWFQINHPEIMRKVHKWLNITDYVLFHLSAAKEFVTDYSIAARTMLFDSWNCCWNQPLLDYFEVSIEQLPQPKLAGTVVGPLAREYAQGSFKETRLIIGGHDHMCALLASGIHDASKALNSTGTAEVMVFPVSRNQHFPYCEVRCNLEHSASPDQRVLMALVSRTGQIIDWANRFLGLFKWAEQPDFKKSLAENIEKRPFFIPPYRRMAPYLTGGFSKVQCSHDERELSLAVMEGVCFEVRDLIEQVNENLDTKTESIKVVGGIANSLPFMFLKSAILGRKLEIIYDIDMTSLGAFVLCGIGLKEIKEPNTFVDHLLSKYKSIDIAPDPYLSSIYESRFQQYLKEREFLSTPTLDYCK